MAKRLAAARAAKERRRIDGVAPLYPVDLPDVRREVIVRDYDFGLVEYHFELRRTRRRDCYTLVCDGEVIAPLIGWAKALAVIRKGFCRVSG